MYRRSWPLAVSFASAFATTTMARDGRAIGPLDIEVAGTVGFGTDPLAERGPNPLGFGGGGRAGVAFRGLYLGVALAYYAGASDSRAPFSDFSQASRIAEPHSSDHVLTYGLEAGYGFRLLGLLTIRPQIGLGNLTLSYVQPTSSEICGLPCDGTSSGSVHNL